MERNVEIHKDHRFLIPWYLNEGEVNANFPPDCTYTFGKDFIEKYILGSEVFKTRQIEDIFIYDILIDEKEGTVIGDMINDPDKILCRVHAITSKGATISTIDHDTGEYYPRGKKLEIMIHNNRYILRIGNSCVVDFTKDNPIENLSWLKFVINIRPEESLNYDE